MAPISASASVSAAKATGSAWKWPSEIKSPYSAIDQRIVGDGIGFDQQRAGRCPWQRRLHESCTRSSFSRCERRMALPASSLR
jgi:hypothetical protein